MGLFDNVIAEEEAATTATSQQGGYGTQDGGFLILDDTPANTISEIKAEDIPDSAISFLDLSSMNITPAETAEPEIKNDGFSLFLDDSSSSDVVINADETSDQEAEAVENNVTMLSDEPQENAFFNQEPSFEDKAEETLPVAPVKIEPVEAVIADPYAILDKAIDDLEELLVGHGAVKSEKNGTIGDIDEQISDLKQKKQNLANEVKEISLEEEKVNKMILTFKAQKI